MGASLVWRIGAFDCFLLHNFFFFLTVVLAYFISLFACNVVEWIWICKKINLWTRLGRVSLLCFLFLYGPFLLRGAVVGDICKRVNPRFFLKVEFFFCYCPEQKWRSIGDVFNELKSSTTRIILWSKFRMFSIVSDQNRSKKMSSDVPEWFKITKRPNVRFWSLLSVLYLERVIETMVLSQIFWILNIHDFCKN